MTATRIETFQQAFRNLQLQPLVEAEQITSFRVEYGDEWLNELEQKVLDCSDYSNQLFFAGHRGCGKSTLLAEFGQSIEDRYFTVFFSISDLIETPDINHINILFAIAVQLMAKAKDERINIDPEKEASIVNWFQERTKTEESKETIEGEVGFNIFSLIKLKLKTDNVMREEIKTKFTRNSRDLINILNEIAREVKLACGKDIVVIIDDLDKLEFNAVDDIFKQNLNALLQPNFIIIYTIPIAIIRDGVLKKHIEDTAGTRISTMPVLKIYAKGDSHMVDPEPVSEKIETLREILHKRIDDDLFESDIVFKIALSSGGVMRELIRVTQECCRLMLVKLRRAARDKEPIDHLKIDQIIFNQALDILRNDMTITLSKIDREILLQTYKNYRPDDPKQLEFLDLLHNTYAIEYKNTESWYDLHPLVVRQLKLEGLIT